MRRKMMTLGVAALLALGACGGDDSGSSTGRSAASASDGAVESAGSCAELMDAAKPVFVGAFQGLVDQVSEMSMADLAALADDTEGSKAITDFADKLDADGTAIEQKANELECGEDDAQQALCDAVDSIDGKGSTIAETIIGQMASQCD